LLSNAEAKELISIPDATYLFEEDDNKLEQVAQIAADWFECFLLRIGKEFHNKYVKTTTSGFLSPLLSRYGFQINLGIDLRLEKYSLQLYASTRIIKTETASP
jgi:hypothetical protein